MDGWDGLRREGEEAEDDFEVVEARRAEGGASRLGDRSELMSMSVGLRWSCKEMDGSVAMPEGISHGEYPEDVDGSGDR
jgi:hypothetical protein